MKKIKDTEINEKEKRKRGSMEVPLSKKELGCLFLAPHCWDRLQQSPHRDPQEDYMAVNRR